MPETGRLPLSLNFRSQPAVLEFVNALFAPAIGADYEPLRPHRPQVGPRRRRVSVGQRDRTRTRRGD